MTQQSRELRRRFRDEVVGRGEERGPAQSRRYGNPILVSVLERH